MSLCGGEYFAVESKAFLMGESDNCESPKLNINANSHSDLIDWTDTTILEPSFTYSVTTNEIKEMIESKAFSEFKILELSCHIQSVESHIKLVTEASSLACDHASREGLIRNKLSSRATTPCFNSTSSVQDTQIKTSA